MTAFTPGPYEVASSNRLSDGEYDYGIGAKIDGRKYCIAEAFGRVADDIRPPAAANAYLLAQAPALYKCLEDLISNVESGSYESTGQCIEECKAVLQKARGE